MANSQAIQEAILKAVDAVVTQRNNELELDKTIIAIVKKNVGLKNGKTIYQVQYSGGIIEATCQNKEDVYKPYTAVYVLVPQGNFSNEKIIIGQVESMSTESSTIVSEDNTYTPLCTNLLSYENEIYGLHSWHETNAYDTNETHRYQYIYQKDNDDNSVLFNKDILNTIKEDAIALKIEADFQTKLDIEQQQQLQARYGLIFNFAFTNSNNAYGETNGEILNNLAQLSSDSFSDQVQKINEQLIEAWEYENRKVISQELSQYYRELTEFYNELVLTSSELETEKLEESINNYKQLIQDLEAENSISAQKETYNNWLNTKVADANYKYEQFVLDSNTMTGNPFIFTNWNTQSKIFKINKDILSHLDSIIFFQEGFNKDYNNEIILPLDNPGGPDILMRNPKISLLKSVTQLNDYSLRVEPSKDEYDFIFTEQSNTTTQFKATFLRKFYEDLTSNNDTHFYWFKESSFINSIKSDGYDSIGGLGWEKLSNDENSVFTTSIQENIAFKNNYKCVVKYNDITLEYYFSIYNISNPQLKLESDLGTNFSFDAGVPTISIKIKEPDSGNFIEKGYNRNIIYPKYKYKWCLIDNAKTKTFLGQSQDEMDVLSSLTQKITWGNIKEEILLSTGEIIDSFDHEYTTRIQCPMNTINNSFDVICYVQKKDEANNDYYEIGSAELHFVNNKDNINIADYRIQILNNDQVFKYDVYGKAPTDESNKNPLVIKPLQVKLMTLADVEVSSKNYEVEWIFPATDNTLLISPDSNKTSIKTKGCSFDIKKDYDPNCYDNQVVCHIVIDGKHLYKNTSFFFGKEGDNGTNGTDVIAKIEYIKDDDPNHVLINEPATLYIHNDNGIWKSFVNTDISRNLQKKQFIFKDKNGEQAISSIFDVFLYQRSEKMDYAAEPKYMLAGNRDGRFFDTGLHVVWNGEGVTDNTLPLIQNIKAEVKVNAEETYYAFVSLPIIEYNLSPVSESELISINRHLYLNEVVYNADGRNPIYNHNQGLKLNLPSDITKVEYLAQGGFEKDSWTDPIKDEKVNLYLEGTPCFSLLESRDSQNKGQFITKTGEDKNIIYVLPDDTFNGSSTNNRIEAKCYRGNILVATVYAPINMTLNTFGLASLNAWDGNTVTIDEEGGYVMAPQVGAGEKDSNNRFTGILMGKTETYTGGAEKEKQIGLFGYACGLQSIFLDAETGNATFGLPEGYTIEKHSGISIPVQKEDEYGEGRIEFRPGGESKIGGWKIGRRSLYYTMKPFPILDMTTKQIADYRRKAEDENSYKYGYSGEIGPKYWQDEETPQNRQYANHHKKDIGVHDSGILLSSDPPYLSIVGTMLTQEEVDQSLKGGYLQEGDSLEIQLDPQTPTVFTIFRHNSEFRKQQVKEEERRELGDRTFLAGINARGQLQANLIGSSTDGNIQSSMYFDLTDRFKVPNVKNYIGAIFEAEKSVQGNDGLEIVSKPYLKLLLNENSWNSNGDPSIYISMPGPLALEFGNMTFNAANIAQNELPAFTHDLNNHYVIQATSFEETINKLLAVIEDATSWTIQNASSGS